MAAFRDDPSECQRLDWRILQNSAIALYWRASVLAEDRSWLEGHGYRVYRFECDSWRDRAALHRDIAGTLHFPDYYGENLDALNDCLSDLEIPHEGGVAIELLGFDSFHRRESELASALLDILATQARRHLLLGRRLLVLAQSDDPQLTLPPIGAQPVMWNPRECLNADRELDQAS